MKFLSSNSDIHVIAYKNSSSSQRGKAGEEAIETVSSQKTKKNRQKERTKLNRDKIKQKLAGKTVK